MTVSISTKVGAAVELEKAAKAFTAEERDAVTLRVSLEREADEDAPAAVKLRAREPSPVVAAPLVVRVRTRPLEARSMLPKEHSVRRKAESMMRASRARPGSSGMPIRNFPCNPSEAISRSAAVRTVSVRRSGAELPPS